jgi:UDP-glucose 4-epimerase
MSVLVTGGAGYIGSHMAHTLIDRGESVVVLDNLSTGVRAQVPEKAVFVQGDIADSGLVRRLIEQHGIEAVIHFAGSIIVPESVANPLLYYANNTAASRSLIADCVALGVRNFIFSSTAAVYGMPSRSPVAETDATDPINPYGRSKLMTEWMLQDVAAVHELRFVILRYFNVAGADPGGRTGQSTPNATHLIKRAAQAALGDIPYLEIFGTDYPTPDGTGVRDYIHVSDLVDAHMRGLESLRKGGQSAIYNCGYGRGLSVQEIISAMERASGKTLSVRKGPRRAGDPAMIVGDSTKLQRALGWRPTHDEIGVIVNSALAWETRIRTGVRK